MIQIAGIAISRYRSFRDELQFVSPMSKINLVVGQNNSGKSNLLTYLQRVVEPTVGEPAGQARVTQLAPLDIPIGLGNGLASTRYDLVEQIDRASLFIRAANGQT